MCVEYHGLALSTTTTMRDKNKRTTNADTNANIQHRKNLSKNKNEK